MDDLVKCWKIMFPNSRVNGLIMGTPVYNCDLDAENKYVAQSITDDKNRLSIMTRPQMLYGRPKSFCAVSKSPCTKFLRTRLLLTR